MYQYYMTSPDFFCQVNVQNCYLTICTSWLRSPGRGRWPVRFGRAHRWNLSLDTNCSWRHGSWRTWSPWRGRGPVSHQSPGECGEERNRKKWHQLQLRLKSKFTIQVSDQLSAPSTQTEANLTFWSDYAPLWELVNGKTSALLHWLKRSAWMQSWH